MAAVQVAKPAARTKARGAKKAKKLTERVFRTAAGPRVSVEFKRGLDAPLMIAALHEALALLQAEIGSEGRDAA